MDTGTTEQHGPRLQEVSNALVSLHKEHFGRGPIRARSDFAGADGLMCVLEDALLPAERKMVELGSAGEVRDTRQRFQAAAADEFIKAVEEILGRKVRAFASGLDAERAVVFETFQFEPKG
jgi:uncharacterized protein YbcI